MATSDLDSLERLKRTPAHATTATSLKERKCSVCPRAIPAGETHVYDGERRWHAECYRKSA